MESAPSVDYLSFRLADDYLSILERKIQYAVETFVVLPPSQHLSKLFDFSTNPSLHESFAFLISPMANNPDFFIEMLNNWKEN